MKNRGNEESGITWMEYKSMTFTHMVSWVKLFYTLSLSLSLSLSLLMTFLFLIIFQVINETLRLGNIVPGIFRGVTKDIEMKGKFNITLGCCNISVLQ